MVQFVTGSLGKEGRPHRTHAICRCLEARLSCCLRQTIAKTRRALFQCSVNVFVAQPSQRKQARSHRERISGKRARLINRSGGRDVAHEFATAAVSADRQPAADYFAQAGDVRFDAVKLLARRRARGEIPSSLHRKSEARRERWLDREPHLENLRCGGTQPMFPTTGSMITAAMS